MGYADYIGRVGGLAVALGVGMAVASTPGVAWADNSDSGTATASSGDTSSAPAAARGSRAARAAQGSQESSSGATPGVSRSPRPAASVGAGQPRRDSTLTEVQAAVASVRVQTNSIPVSAPTAAGDGDASAPSAPSWVARTVAPVEVGTPLAAATAAPLVSSITPGTAAAVTAGKTPIKTAILNAITKNSAHPQLLKAILAQFLGSGSGGQTQLPSLWAVLGLVRRELGKNSPLSAPASTVTSSAGASPNLLFNAGGEIGTPTPSGMTSTTIPGWTVTGTPSLTPYGAPRTIWSVGTSSPMPNLPARLSFPHLNVGPSVNGTPTGGNQFFAGGPVADSSMSQTVDLSGASVAIDTGTVGYNLSGWLGGYTLDPSAASVKITFLDGSGKTLGSDKLDQVGLFKRLFATSFKQETATGLLPENTRSALVEVTFTDKNPIKYGLNARFNDAFADNLSFTIDAPLSAPTMAPPVSTVGQLDHVFMVYMENKGYSDIVGSPLAPYLNGLINTYGFAESYYALTHGSLPNYYPIIGGSNFGITYNCAKACIDVPLNQTLPGRIDQAGLVWKSYAQSLAPGADPTVSSGDYAFDETGFPAYSAISSDVNYAKAHIVPLEQMAIDLQSNATAPAFGWFAANEDFNGEGPVSGVSGMLKFALSQLNPKHPYNVPALDQYLSETVPVILNSNVWNDPTQKSMVVVTFDEDNNNTNLGFSHDGNRIVTVVIPSPGAIAAGMRGGAFTSSQQYDHYSLLRTIEESLGLPNQFGYLTLNDQWAQPMNDFWTTPSP